MYKIYFSIFLLGHVLGDFYLQVNKMAERKKDKVAWILIHSAFYLAGMMLVIIPFISWEMILIAFIMGILHLLIDLGKYILISSIDKKGKMTNKTDRNLFFLDQGLHLISIVMVAYLITSLGLTTGEARWCKSFFDTINLSGREVLSWLLAFLIIHKPTNIAIQKLLMIYRPEGKEEEPKQKTNAGSVIGTLERIIIVIFFGIKEYGAIGLVLTAKSIARYDKITKEKDFADYYLLGTLISSVIGIVVALII